MKIAIVFFTGTGSTAYYAQILGSKFSNQHSLSYFRIEKLTAGALGSYDLIGIGTPTYAYRAPRIVTSLMRKILPPKKPVFFFCTCGGAEGNTIWNLYRIAKSKDCIFLGSTVAYGPNNLRAWRPLLNSESPGWEGLGYHTERSAQDFIVCLEQKLQNLDLNGQLPENPPKHSTFLSLFTALFTFAWQMRATVGKKHVDRSKCTQCELCATKICPSGCISIGNAGYPEFQESRCVGCSGCVSLCPSLAIWSKPTQKHHPYQPYQNYVLNFPKDSPYSCVK